MPHPLSSGDPTADRRFAYAMEYRKGGNLTAAAELVEQALQLAPNWAAGWFSLGDLLEENEEPDRAIAAFRKSLNLDESDRAGAGARLARLGVRNADGALTAAHIAALFDDYAPRFETSLVRGLNYRGPALLRDALKACREPLAFGRAIDLGCGTGLVGEHFCDICAAIDGVDLSAHMLARARSKHIYNRLEKADVLAYLRDQPGGDADLILAADVFIYIGDLEAVFVESARVLRPGGLFAFSAQRHDGPDAFVLGHDMRYAHSHRGIKAWAGHAGLHLLHRNEESAREDRAVPVPGMIVVFSRPA